MRAGWMAALAAVAAAACSHTGDGAGAHPDLAPGDTYVAMGSSFAAGPGVSTYPEDPAAPCYRSADNYARQLAKARGLALTDVSCSGATTAHLLGPRDAIPPQIEALTADTRLVTITIGGNDIGYVARLGSASCAGLARETGSAEPCRPLPPAPAEADYAELQTRMASVAAEVRRRSPQARLVFVDYLTVLPPDGACAATPLDPAQAALVREMARRLAAITAEVAREAGAEVLKASDLSGRHSACATEPWMTGYSRPGAPVAVPYHPNLAGMTAVAEALDRMLGE